MNKERIFDNNGYGKATRSILLGVEGDNALVTLPDSAGGSTWSSSCKEVENEAGRFNITIIKKDGEVVGKLVYNCDDETEKEFVWNNNEKCFDKVVEK